LSKIRTSFSNIRSRNALENSNIAALSFFPHPQYFRLFENVFLKKIFLSLNRQPIKARQIRVLIFNLVNTNKKIGVSMFPHNEFKKYATKHHGISTMHLENYMKRSVSGATAIAKPDINAMTPYIIEERQLNVAQMDVFSRLMMDRIIFMGVPVDDHMANIIQAQLLFLESTDPKRDVQMFINSPGGSVIDGLAIYDTMQYIAPDVATVCTGLAASMASVLLAAGQKGKRSCLTHSHIMIHQPSGGTRGQVSDIEINYRLIKKMQKNLYDIYVHHTGQEYETIEKDCNRDSWMTGDEAKEYGIIDEVLARGVRKDV
jgi:ATP-dependent Clp protease, protease subunit